MNCVRMNLLYILYYIYLEYSDCMEKIKKIIHRNLNKYYAIFHYKVIKIILKNSIPIFRFS